MSVKMKIYLDEKRTTPEGWVRCYRAEEVVFFLQNCAVDEISLDHDLGDDNRGTGYDILLWIKEEMVNRNYQPPKITIHSVNAAARVKMELARDNILNTTCEIKKTLDTNFFKNKIIELHNIDEFKKNRIELKRAIRKSTQKKSNLWNDEAKKHDSESSLKNKINNCQYHGSGLLAFFYKNLIQVREGAISDQFFDIEDLNSWDLDYLNPELGVDLYELRNLFTKINMWSLVDQSWTGKLANFLDGKKALEVGAGSGYLAKALSQYGIDIIATDISPGVGAGGNKCDLVFDVIQMEAVEAIKKHHHNALIISWPEYDSDMAVRCIEAVSADTTIIYIGEWASGCNANDDFFFSVDVEEIIDIPSWNGVHDQLYILKKCENMFFEALLIAMKNYGNCPLLGAE